MRNDYLAEYDWPTFLKRLVLYYLVPVTVILWTAVTVSAQHAPL